MKNLLTEIKKGKILMCDGATGTMLQSKGITPDESPEGWNLVYPDKVREIYQAYKDAGSDIVATNTFGGTAFKQAEFGLDDKIYELNKVGAEISRDVIGNDGFVIGAVGPTGQIAYDEGGLVTNEDLYKAFKQQIKALVDGGVDAICIETMMSVIEACEAIKAAKENTSLPIICTFTYELGARGYRTMMGADCKSSSLTAYETGADIVGANCGNGIDNMVEIAKLIRSALPDVPMLVQANAGLPVFENGKTVFKETPQDMAAKVTLLADIGVNIIGGCCGTNPDHIRAMAEVIKKY